VSIVNLRIKKRRSHLGRRVLVKKSVFSIVAADSPPMRNALSFILRWRERQLSPIYDEMNCCPCDEGLACRGHSGLKAALRQRGIALWIITLSLDESAHKADVYSPV
jgi:hypothetical protein